MPATTDSRSAAVEHGRPPPARDGARQGAAETPDTTRLDRRRSDA